MSFRPAQWGEIPIVRLLPIREPEKARLGHNFSPTSVLLIVASQGFLGLWPRNDVEAEQLQVFDLFTKHFPFFGYMYVPSLLRSSPATATGLGHPSELPASAIQC
jgi:hypothetical protein